MKTALKCGPAALTLAWATQAQACQCPYWEDAEMVRSEIAALARYDVALDGVVTEASGPPPIATIRASRIWFGAQQQEFRIKYVDMCSEIFAKGDQVRLALKKLPEESGFWARLRQWLSPEPRLYEASSCSYFRSAMRYRSMREAVSKRAGR